MKNDRELLSSLQHDDLHGPKPHLTYDALIYYLISKVTTVIPVRSLLTNPPSTNAHPETPLTMPN